jgi:hypothetical protein
VWRLRQEPLQVHGRFLPTRADSLKSAVGTLGPVTRRKTSYWCARSRTKPRSGVGKHGNHHITSLGQISRPPRRRRAVLNQLLDRALRPFVHNDDFNSGRGDSAPLVDPLRRVRCTHSRQSATVHRRCDG